MELRGSEFNVHLEFNYRKMPQRHKPACPVGRDTKNQKALTLIGLFLVYLRALGPLWQKSLLYIFLFGSFVCTSSAQSILPHYPDSLFSTYYHQRVTQFRLLPDTKNDIIFLGNSITDGGEWTELFHNIHIINRGISGDVTAGVLNRLNNIVNRKPAKVFLLIGINDLARGVSPDSVLKNISKIVSLIHEYTPVTKVYVQSLFPVNPAKHIFPTYVNKGVDIIYINRHLEEDAVVENYTYIDVYDALKDSTVHLSLHYANDGLHLSGTGYMVWKHVVFPYVYGLQQKPSLVPLPQSVHWRKEKFPLYKCKTIVVQEASLMGVAKDLQRIFAKEGREVQIVNRFHQGSLPFIELRLGKVSSVVNNEEAYELIVSNEKVMLTANTAHGIFNGIQTMRQLMRDGTFMDGCDIKDWPAFPWRGYMVDVGRNFQTVNQLKQQINVMSHYKLNIFHIHLTENIAWRLQVKRYPQLTATDNMLRNKGQYYTIAEMKDLIQYCKDRFITLVPEIDMPGHSNAFTRAFGFDMQSEKGLAVVKNILNEFDSTYNNKEVPYLHIGADEVKFTNKDFIPEVTNLIHQAGKRTIGWAPGGNYDDKTIRQLWQSEGPQKDQRELTTIQYIDSRDLYLNHLDPLSGVVSIFDRRIDGVNKGNASMLGGEICVWNDDRAKDEKDILLMNAVYPDILAFAERSWQGGGYNGFVSDIGSDTSARAIAFKEFEERLLDQKKLFFKNLPFPYVKQSDINWRLFGPFKNFGDSAAIFWPEQPDVSLTDSVAELKVTGATIWLRHFFTPLVSAWLKHPEDSTTWYAFTRLYSPVDTTGYLWIGFYNPSRSHVVSTPQLGHWDTRGSKIWLNGSLVPPPEWTYPGRDDNTENPLVDEDYEYRKPAEVHFKKGWNNILLKLPVESFRGKDWQHPVKWMFTVVPVQKISGINWYRSQFLIDAP